MHYGLWILPALASALAPPPTLQPAPDAPGLELKRVMLSTGGVGYFEYEARVRGTADLPLRVRLDQMDDVLKSIVVYDERGNLGEARVAGRELLTEALRDLPFREADLASTATLLDALRGADVEIESARGVVRGKVISVSAEEARLSTGETITRHRLTLLVNGALAQSIVEDITRVKVMDPTLEAQLEAAVRALSAQRERDAREITLHIAGDGGPARVVRVAYVAEAPLWKSTYRLTLPSEPRAETATLEGFAVVENRSGQAWSNIELTLAAGNPVTFRQALYETYYVTRPEVPVEVLGRVLPRPDEGGVPATPAPSVLDRALGVGAERERAYRAFHAEAARPELAALGTEEATQVTFRLPQLVSLADGQSMLLPILTRALPAERVSLFQPETDRRHPLSSVRLTNDGTVDIPPGAVALYDMKGGDGTATYVGDARLAFMPRGASRFLSYAVDLRVTIDASEASAQTVTLARIVDGTLSLTRTERRATTYTIAGPADEARSVILEHTRLADFTLVPSPDYAVVEALPDRYRLRVEVPAGKVVKLTVAQDRPIVENVAVTNIADDQLAAYATSSELSPAIRAALARVASLRASVRSAEATLSRQQAEEAQITADQARVRENLKAVPEGSDLYKRYLSTLAEEEERLSKLRAEISASQQAVARAQEALAAYIRSLSL